MAIAIAADIRHRLGPTRDQGARPTCLAFAMSDAHAAVVNQMQVFSSEYIFFHAQRRAGRPLSTGAVLSDALTALKEDGQPLEKDWPYALTTPTNAKAATPPSNLAVFRRHGQSSHGAFDDVATDLDAGKPSVILIQLSDAFYLPDRRGVVRSPPTELPDPKRRHAMVAVGHGAVDGERALLVRNSWGRAWGLEGHAWLSESFIKPRLLRTALLTKEVHVPTQNLAA
jgi:C1A family cysteine protease